MESLICFGSLLKALFIFAIMISIIVIINASVYLKKENELTDRCNRMIDYDNVSVISDRRKENLLIVYNHNEDDEHQLEWAFAKAEYYCGSARLSLYGQENTYFFNKSTGRVFKKENNIYKRVNNSSFKLEVGATIVVVPKDSEYTINFIIPNL